MDRHCEAGMTGRVVDQEWRVGPGRHFGTLWTLVAHHRARPGGYLFDQLGTIDFSEGIFRLLDENLYSA